MFVSKWNFMSNLYKVPYKDASYHVMVHFAKRLQRRFFRNQPIRNNYCLCGHVCERIGTKWANSIKGLPRILPTIFRSFWPSASEETIFWKSTNQKQKLPQVAMFVNGSKLNEHSSYRTLQGCFLPNFDPFGQAASEETIF